MDVSGNPTQCGQSREITKDCFFKGAMAGIFYLARTWVVRWSKND
jgi:hypothetical protein